MYFIYHELYFKIVTNNMMPFDLTLYTPCCNVRILNLILVLCMHFSGMRDGDFSDLIDSISSDFAHEIGPARERPTSLLYESWIDAAGGTIRGVSLQPKVEQLMERCKGIENDGSNEVVQLKFLQQTNIEQMSKLRKMWDREPKVLHHYLSKFIFPEHMKTQRSKLSASGQSIGGDMLVGRRVGFSGTPSDLLPKELGECDYETGDDGKMLSTVSFWDEVFKVCCSNEIFMSFYF